MENQLFLKTLYSKLNNTSVSAPKDIKKVVRVLCHGLGASVLRKRERAWGCMPFLCRISCSELNKEWWIPCQGEHLTLQDREKRPIAWVSQNQWGYSCLGFVHKHTVIVPAYGSTGHPGLVAGAFFHLFYLSAVPLSHFGAPPHYRAQILGGSSRCKTSLKQEETPPSTGQWKSRAWLQTVNASAVQASASKSCEEPLLGRRTHKGRRSWSNLFSLGSEENWTSLALSHVDHFWNPHLFWHCPRQRADRAQHQMRATCWDQVVKIFSVSELLLQGTCITDSWAKNLLSQ